MTTREALSGAGSVAATRPAETGGLAAAVVALIVYFTGSSDPALIVPLLVIVGSVPAVVTWFVGVIRRRNGQA